MKDVIRMLVALPNGSSLIGGPPGPIMSLVLGRVALRRITTVLSDGFSSMTAGMAWSIWSRGLGAPGM